MSKKQTKIKENKSVSDLSPEALAKEEAKSTFADCSLLTAICKLPPVAEMMRDAGLEPKKQLGQNFLFDLNLTRKIARAVPDIENSVVVEVGPGPGGLTRSLLECGAKKVIAIEKDRATEPILRKIAAASDGRLEIVFGDALNPLCPLWGRRGGIGEADDGVVGGGRSKHLPRLFASQGSAKIHPFPKGKGNYAICSNLPYNIGTELLIQWLHAMAPSSLVPHPSSLTLMFQREVAERIVARVGDKQYGRLSVLTALVANAKILFNVPNTAFFPAPKVQSSVVQIIPKQFPPFLRGGGREATGGELITNNLEQNSPHRAPRGAPLKEGGNKLPDLPKVEQITAKLFGNRRKMIRSIMKDVDWTQFGLTGTERAEELSPEKFLEIAARLP